MKVDEAGLRSRARSGSGSSRRSREGFENARRFFSEFEDKLVRAALVLKTSDPDARSEQRLIRQQVLPELESMGWQLTRPMERIAQGARDGETIVQGVDPNTAVVRSSLQSHKRLALANLHATVRRL